MWEAHRSCLPPAVPRTFSIHVNVNEYIFFNQKVKPLYSTYWEKLGNMRGLCVHLIYVYKKQHVQYCAQSPQSCPALCDPMDSSLPGSSVDGILQARILESVTIPFSRGSSQPRVQSPASLHCRLILYLLSHLGSPTKKLHARVQTRRSALEPARCVI